MEVKVELDTRGGEKIAALSITHNGRQWSTIRIGNQDEINQVIEALQNFSGLKPKIEKLKKQLVINNALLSGRLPKL